MNGNGRFQTDSGQGLYASNLDTLYAAYGYTEFIELIYDKSMYISALLIGKNRGMRAMKNILAKDPLGNWMTM